MGRWDKGVPCLSLGSPGWNIWGSSAPSLPFHSRNYVFMFPWFIQVSVSAVTLAQSCSFPPSFSPSLPAFIFSFSLQIYFRESEMGNIEMDEIPVLKVTADGKLFRKERWALLPWAGIWVWQLGWSPCGQQILPTEVPSLLSYE